MTVPQAAITAAMNAIYAENAKVWGEAAATSEEDGGETEGFASAILAAAAPHIRRDERESIRQLAIRKRAVYCLACDGAPCGYDDILRPFADLLTDDDAMTVTYGPEGDPT